MTEEEAAFAAEHFYLIRYYLRSRSLDPEEWFDVVVIRYLDSVKRWFTEPELHVYSFSTIASGAMRSALWSEREKRRRRLQTISLSAPIPGIDGLTYGDAIAAPWSGYI